MSITLTDNAAEKIKGLMSSHKMPASACLRVGVRGGGCEGLTYSLDVTDKPGDQDEVFECGGVRIVCDPKSYPAIKGTAIDFDDATAAGGFVFKNPNARVSCNCGSSFSK
jgi:iron-sulfur cluster assembly protein